jgi:hypothetical protein
MDSLEEGRICGRQNADSPTGDGEGRSGEGRGGAGVERGGARMGLGGAAPWWGRATRGRVRRGGAGARKGEATPGRGRERSGGFGRSGDSGPTLRKIRKNLAKRKGRICSSGLAEEYKYFLCSSACCQDPYVAQVVFVIEEYKWFLLCFLESLVDAHKLYITVFKLMNIFWDMNISFEKYKKSEGWIPFSYSVSWIIQTYLQMIWVLIFSCPLVHGS